MISYTLIRSKRKTTEIQVRVDGVIVRAPKRLGIGEIDRFVASKEAWIIKKQAEIEKQLVAVKNQPKVNLLTKDELTALANQALAVIPERVVHYARIIGVDYGRITIKNQRTRWGSCSSKGNLNFNCLLMLTPLEVIDSVVVHELCHRKQMNHSKKFYEEVYKAYPEYDKWNKWLKDNGNAIMARNVVLDKTGKSKDAVTSPNLSTREKAKILALEWQAGDDLEEKLAKELREEILARHLVLQDFKMAKKV